jgi:DNA mismatch repair protein MutS
MNETAYILHTATEKSLVIMDEVGRGTGTNDGLSIAWAVSEDLLNRIKCRTLFATHYHELARIRHERMVNRSMEVAEQGGEIIFLRKLKEGPAARSYGLHAARLAGLPEAVLERAGEILDELEESGRSMAAADILFREAGAGVKEKKAGNDSSISGEVLKVISGLDLNAVTPMEALMLLNDWKRQTSGGKAGGEGISLMAPKIKKAPKDPENKTPGLFDSI